MTRIRVGTKGQLTKKSLALVKAEFARMTREECEGHLTRWITNWIKAEGKARQQAKTIRELTETIVDLEVANDDLKLANIVAGIQESSIFGLKEQPPTIH